MAPELPAPAEAVGGFLTMRVSPEAQKRLLVYKLKASRDFARTQAHGLAGCLMLGESLLGEMRFCIRPEGHADACRWVSLSPELADELLDAWERRELGLL